MLANCKGRYDENLLILLPRMFVWVIFNAIFIASISKKREAAELNNCRPINSFGNIYKLNAKILNKKLKDVTAWLISGSQNAFIFIFFLVGTKCIHLWQTYYVVSLIFNEWLDIRLTQKKLVSYGNWISRKGMIILIRHFC